MHLDVYLLTITLERIFFGFATDVFQQARGGGFFEIHRTAVMDDALYQRTGDWPSAVPLACTAV
ncbi:hypothetical protein BFW87_03545 [Pseudomonas fluorescens]|uniref:Uncharacterized protein n=1 Tax=Pseudomonas fluorescens TaxID=294 RepID=A0A1T2Z543_PSEFL|nr:hypothetical protein BFW87_03545 [Pseudomonas fluorescens]